MAGHREKPSHIPLFVDSYLADTTHLTTEQHGAYLLLMMAAWRAPDCSLPHDERRLANFAGVSLARWRKIGPDILEMWTCEGGRWFTDFLPYCENRKRREANFRPAIPAGVRLAVTQRDGTCCVYCKDIEGPFHLDHVIPWSRGGEHTEDNLVVACASCNLSKHDLLISEWVR